MPRLSPPRWSRCSSVTIAERRLAPRPVSTRSPPSPPSRLPDATPTSTETPKPLRRNRLWTVAQWFLAAVAFYFIGKAFFQGWRSYQVNGIHVQLSWTWMIASALVVLATYALLVE